MAYRSPLMSAHMKNHSNLTKIAKIVKNHKNRKKIINIKNHHRLLEIQPTPFYLILILIAQAYNPLFRHSILNIHHRAMKLCIHKRCL